MQRAAALLIGALTQGAIGTKILKAAATATQPVINPCQAAILSVDKNINVDIELALGKQVFIPSEISSSSACPYECTLKIAKPEIVSNFDKTTGDLIVFTDNTKL